MSIEKPSMGSGWNRFDKIASSSNRNSLHLIKRDERMHEVAIARVNLNSLQSEVEKLLGLIGYKPARRKILLKPNIVVASRPEEADMTHPKVVEGLVRYFQKRDCETVVAEGTGIFSTEKEFERLLKTTGYDSIRDGLGIPVINLEQVERERVPWKYGTIPLPRMLRDYEYVNVPTMKTHLQSIVSLGVKNQKGLIPMKTKKMFHKKALHGMLHFLGITYG